MVPTRVVARGLAPLLKAIQDPACIARLQIMI